MKKHNNNNVIVQNKTIDLSNNGFGIPLQTYSNVPNNNINLTQNNILLTQEKRNHIPRPNKLK